MVVWVSQLVHHFASAKCFTDMVSRGCILWRWGDYEWNVSATLGWIVMTFGAVIHVCMYVCNNGQILPIVILMILVFTNIIRSKLEFLQNFGLWPNTHKTDDTRIILSCILHGLSLFSPTGHRYIMESWTWGKAVVNRNCRSIFKRKIYFQHSQRIKPSFSFSFLRPVSVFLNNCRTSWIMLPLQDIGPPPSLMRQP